MSQVSAVGDDNFDLEVLQSAVPVLVDFWAPWCGPCRMVAPMLDEMAQDYEGRLKIVKCDVDKFEPLSLQYGVQKIPNLMFFKSGEPVAQVVGFTSPRQLHELADEVLGS
jgi:thioredoxin 1